MVYPSLNDDELVSWFDKYEIWFVDKANRSNVKSMRECFSYLKTHNGMVFWRLSPTCVSLRDNQGHLTPDDGGVIPEGEVVATPTHENGTVAKAFTVWAVIPQDYLEDRLNDDDLREDLKEADKYIYPQLAEKTQK